MKALQNIFLFAAATAIVLFLWAFFTVASQSSDPTGLYHAAIKDWPSLAVDYIQKHLMMFLRWGVILFLALPIITKTIRNRRRGRHSTSDAHPATDDAGPRSQTAWEQLNEAKRVKLADPAPMKHHHVS